jgi:RimJ/RimL family protein N-acetyltransferase
MPPARVLQGEKTRLRPLREDDLLHLVRWFNTPDVRHWLHASDRPDATLDGVRRHFWAPVEEGRTAAWLMETSDGTPIGVLRLLDIDPHHRRAELAVSIGETAYWDSGYGTDAIRQSLRYAFQDLGLRRVDLITDADNERGIRCYEKCGFVREGLLRERRLRFGEPIDMLVMGILREEWSDA